MIITFRFIQLWLTQKCRCNVKDPFLKEEKKEKEEETNECESMFSEDHQFPLCDIINDPFSVENYQNYNFSSILRWKITTHIITCIWCFNVAVLWFFFFLSRNVFIFTLKCCTPCAFLFFRPDHLHLQFWRIEIAYGIN